MVENNRVIVDSNIVIYSANPAYELLRDWLKKSSLILSDISRIEIMGYHRLVEEEKKYFKRLFDYCNFYHLTEETISKAIILRQQRSMGLGDSIIAATALSANLPLISANTKDFRHIKELTLIGLDEIMG